MIRALSFFVLLIVAFTGPVQIFIVGLAAYGLYFSGYEIVVLAIFVDALFGSSSLVPIYTLGAAGWLLVIIFFRPYLVLDNYSK